MREDDRKDIPERRERDEDAECALGLGAEDVTEERSSQDTSARRDLLARDGSKVRDVDEHVENADAQDAERCSELECADRVLHLGHGVVGVAVADVAPDDVVERGHDAVRRAGGSLEGVREVVRLLHLQMPTERGEASEDDDEQDEQLDDAQEVLEAQTPL